MKQLSTELSKLKAKLNPVETKLSAKLKQSKNFK